MEPSLHGTLSAVYILNDLILPSVILESGTNFVSRAETAHIREVVIEVIDKDGVESTPDWVLSSLPQTMLPVLSVSNWYCINKGTEEVQNGLRSL